MKGVFWTEGFDSEDVTNRKEVRRDCDLEMVWRENAARLCLSLEIFVQRMNLVKLWEEKVGKSKAEEE